jgi:hypothetical protein
MAGLVIASRVYPTCAKQFMRKSGKPDFRCIHVFLLASPQDVDARVKPAHDA